MHTSLLFRIVLLTLSTILVGCGSVNQAHTSSATIDTLSLADSPAFDKMEIQPDSSVTSVVQLTSTMDSFISVLIAFLSAIGTIAVAVFAWGQFRILRKEKSSYLSAHTFVRQIMKPNYGTTTYEYVKHHISFYVRVYNTGSTAIDDLWIDLPEDVEVFVPAFMEQNYKIEVFRVRRAIMPGGELTIELDGELFFGNNIEFDPNRLHHLRIKYKSPIESGYNSVTIPFDYSAKEESPDVDYKLSVEQAIRYDGSSLEPYRHDHFNRL